MPWPMITVWENGVIQILPALVRRQNEMLGYREEEKKSASMMV